MLLKQAQTCPDQRTIGLQFLPFNTLRTDLRQGVGHEILENLDAHDTPQSGLVATTEARPVVRETHAHLGHVALYDVPLQRHSENPLFVERHAQNQKRLVKFRDFLEQGAQIVRTAEDGGNVR